MLELRQTPEPGASVTIGKGRIVQIPIGAWKLASTWSFTNGGTSAPAEIDTESRAGNPTVGGKPSQRVSAAIAKAPPVAPRTVVVSASLMFVVATGFAQNVVTVTRRPELSGWKSCTKLDCAATLTDVRGCCTQRSSSLRKLHSGRSDSSVNPGGGNSRSSLMSL